MAHDIAAQLIDAQYNKIKRSNFDWDNKVQTSADFGFIKPIFTTEVLANTGFTFDMRSAISTNPTVTPVLSRAKVQYTAWWIPARLYVPALRDGVKVKAGETDYAFPTINFPYDQYQTYWSQISIPSHDSPSYTDMRLGRGFPYIPGNSIFTSLGMWSPNFDPYTFVSKGGSASFGVFPEPKNAIPLLGYYDIFRNYFMNSQEDSAPIRLFSSYAYTTMDPPSGSSDNVYTANNHLSPVDIYVDRDSFDYFFKMVRQTGSQYPEQLQSTLPSFYGSFDISRNLANLYQTLYVNEYDKNYAFDIVSFAPFRTYLPSSPNGNIGADEYAVPIPIRHFGECRTTYLNDYFTAFLSNENVEYERSTARVQLGDDNTITMEQIYSAQRVQNFIRRSVFRNSDFAEYIDVQYGVKPRTDITKPMFLGSISSWLTWNDVISTTQSGEASPDTSIDSNINLGSRASLGFGMTVTGRYRPKKERPFVRFETKEPGYFMVLQTIVPEVSYYRGFDPMYSKRSLGSLYYPSFDKDGYQDAQFQYLVECPARDVPAVPPGSGQNTYPNYLTSTNFLNWNVAYAQQPAWFEYMAKYDRLDGDFADPTIYMNWTFHRGDYRFNGVEDDEDDSTLPDFINYYSTSYVQPELFNYIFANAQNVDNFQCFFNFDVNVYQPMSHRILSF